MRYHNREEIVLTEILINDCPFIRHPSVRGAALGLSLTMQQVIARAKQEADGNAVWATWKPGVLTPLDSLGVLPKASGNLNFDIDAAIAADFVVTP